MYGNGPEFELLFWSGDGMNARQGQVTRAAASIDDMTEQKIQANSDDEILAQTQEKFRVDVPTLDRENISFERKIKKIRQRSDWGDYYEREVVAFYFEIPFEGEPEIFKLRPNSYNSNPPRGEVRGNILRISVVGEEDTEKLQQTVSRTLDDVEQYLQWHRKMWAGLVEDISREVKSRLVARRQKISKLGATEAGLTSLGFKPKA